MHSAQMQTGLFGPARRELAACAMGRRYRRAGLPAGSVRLLTVMRPAGGPCMFPGVSRPRLTAAGSDRI